MNNLESYEIVDENGKELVNKVRMNYQTLNLDLEKKKKKKKKRKENLSDCDSFTNYFNKNDNKLLDISLISDVEDNEISDYSYEISYEYEESEDNN